jgi:integrase/recombinase XerD
MARLPTPAGPDPVILWAQFNAWMLDEQGWSKWTRKTRLSAVKRAHSFIHGTYGRTLVRATPEHLIGFLHEAPTPRTRNTYLSALQAFYAFLKAKRHRRGDPTLGIKRVKEPLALPRPLSAKEAQKLLASAKLTSPRAYVVVAILLYTGLRREEATRLNWADVSLETMELRVMGKGAKERVVPVTKRLLPVLVGWREVSPTGWLFPSPIHLDGPMGVLRLWRDVKDAAWQVRMAGVSTHRLRHTFATEYLRQNPGAIRQLQKILGHSSLASTQIYTAVSSDELREGMEQLDFGA